MSLTISDRLEKLEQENAELRAMLNKALSGYARDRDEAVMYLAAQRGNSVMPMATPLYARNDFFTTARHILSQ
jgi:hypothetical protein